MVTVSVTKVSVAIIMAIIDSNGDQHILATDKIVTVAESSLKSLTVLKNSK